MNKTLNKLEITLDKQDNKFDKLFNFILTINTNMERNYKCIEDIILRQANQELKTKKLQEKLCILENK